MVSLLSPYQIFTMGASAQRITDPDAVWVFQMAFSLICNGRAKWRYGSS